MAKHSENIMMIFKREKLCQHCQNDFNFTKQPGNAKNKPKYTNKRSKTRQT